MGTGKVLFGGVFEAECYDKHGNLKWRDRAPNLVTNTGIDHVLDILFAGSTPYDPWYTGLLATTDVQSTHRLGDISEATEYSQATRPIFVDVRSAQSVTNSAGKSTFSIDKDATTIEGAFLCSSNAIGDTVGTLLSGGVFSGGTKVGDSGDSVVVTYTFTGADDGV
jgi:hypothetical protein